ncbi:MAG: AAA family ATPase [Pirellulales bacterium]|nr:AAA family ATPase [Pirellulales bacterium]
MLKALELVGFKSFAERTRLEFPPGITVVVGPNGSGKSNIVDAIKWVLGEQSVKSLRGKEMIDVIFNGAAGRKPLNMAEVTLVFDNAQRRLGLDTPEVAVTRRVYRSGEGEYLLNNTPCRLRDFRDLFAGTGVATEAYSVIEQGKVDILLQSSPRDRRLIFEEAAGISRFKAKKLECQRRLERVDQNLLRLSDIVDEVENRLKSVRLQATKARRYQEYAERLQTLRTQVAWTDWRSLTDQITQHETELAELHAEWQGLLTQAEAQEGAAQALDAEIQTLEQTLQTDAAHAARNRERLAALEAAQELDRGRAHDLEENLSRYRRQWLALHSRAGDLAGTHQEVTAALATAQQQQRICGSRLADEERHLTTLNAQVDQLRGENEQARAQYLEQLRGVAALANEISGLQAQLARSEERRDKCLRRLAEVETLHGSCSEALTTQLTNRGQLTDQLHALQLRGQTARGELADTRARTAECQAAAAAASEHVSRLQERAQLLSAWDAQQAGVEEGVKALLNLARQEPAGPLRQIRGMLAELFHTSVSSAPAIEAILAEHAQALVYVPSAEFDEYLRAPRRWPGRVSFLPWGANLPETSPRENAADLAAIVDLRAYPGVLGHVRDLLETASEYRPLFERLLGNCWLVRDLSVAHELASAWPPQAAVTANSAQNPLHRPHHPDPQAPTIEGSSPQVILTGAPIPPAWLDKPNADSHPSGGAYPRGTQPVRDETAATVDSISAKTLPLRPTFVTPAGEVLWPSGMVTLGVRHGPGGLISRRSELRELRQELQTGETALRDLREQAEALQRQASERERHVQEMTAAEQQCQAELAELRAKISADQERQAQFAEQLRLLAADALAAAEQSQAVIQTRTQAELKLEQGQLQLAQAESRQQENARRLDQLEETRQQRQREAMSVKVELARTEQQVENLRRQLRQFEQDQAERQRGLAELTAQIAETQERINQAEETLLANEQHYALFTLKKETFHEDTQELLAARGGFQQTRAASLQAAQRLRQKAHKQEEKRHKRELAAEAVRHERATLAARLREDYGIELAELTAPPTAEEARERAAVEEEISDLRRKLTNLGGVNLEALQEAAELETRYEHLSMQFRDLTQGKAALEQIIHKINVDSRRLFLETLEQVKEHFQSLFRKLFGGGRADIVLEEGEDILESGIEIVARPPGKEPRNISLLSGGEKTLTCVALLLSIFRSRPSPFCVLDEVDAALDEANIERFVSVLKEFLNWTQFIVVTHSKKTMACGHTLYGVTMQESGISKRVSVRFEDVHENGEIRVATPGTAAPDAA